MNEENAPAPAPGPQTEAALGERRVLRFTRLQRAQHWAFAASFSTLGLTGLVQKFAASPLAGALIAGMGGIENVRLLHRIAAVTMMLVVVAHLGEIGYRLFVRRQRPSILPGMLDVQNAIQALAYGLGLRKTRPQQGRFTFEEKLEYWAVVWGTAIMVITGFMMWNPIATARLAPGEFIPAAKAAHGGEALLAVLSILLWHFYHVLVRRFNRSMFIGYLSEEEMLEEHPIELADLKAGAVAPPAKPEEIARRQRLFFPVFSLAAAAMLVGIYLFVASEQTAIASDPPPETVAVYAPLPPTPLPTLPPSPTPPPTQAAQPTQAGQSTPAGPASLTWKADVGPLLQAKCAGCHGAANAMAGLNLNTFAGALQGGASGPAIVPGEPESSRLLAVQSAGNHPGQLSQEELAELREWIAGGAPEE